MVPARAAVVADKKFLRDKMLLFMVFGDFGLQYAQSIALVRNLS
jgi:hypothetical protein